MTIFGKERRQLRRSKPMHLIGAPFGIYDAFLSIRWAFLDGEARLSSLDCLQGGTGAEQDLFVK